MAWSAFVSPAAPAVNRFFCCLQNGECWIDNSILALCPFVKPGSLEVLQEILPSQLHIS